MIGRQRETRSVSARLVVLTRLLFALEFATRGVQSTVQFRFVRGEQLRRKSCVLAFALQFACCERAFAPQSSPFLRRRSVGRSVGLTYRSRPDATATRRDHDETRLRPDVTATTRVQTRPRPDATATRRDRGTKTDVVACPSAETTLLPTTTTTARSLAGPKW